MLASRSALTTVAPEETSGALVGTVPYMAPEQLEGKAVDARTDVFALGLRALRDADGAAGVRGGEAASVITAILTSEPAPVSALQPVTPPLLDRLVRTCLAKDPAKRWDSAHDVAEQLRAISDTSAWRAAPPAPSAATGTVAAPARWWTRRRAVLAGAAALLVVAAAVVVALWPRNPPPAASLDPRTVAVTVFENRTGDSALDSLGQSLAESIADGLAPVEAVTAVPGATVFSSHQRRNGAARGSSDPVRALAEATVLASSCPGRDDLQGQTLWVRTSITDVVAGKPFYALPPIELPREKPFDAVRLVRQQVLDTIAARHFNPWANLLLEELRPPSFEAQRDKIFSASRSSRRTRRPQSSISATP